MPDNDNIKFKKFKETLPDNLKNTNEETYNLRGYWEALGKPEEFDYSQPKEADGYYHAFSRNPQTGEILKKENHPTFKMAIEGDIKAGYKAYRNKKTGKIYTFKEEPDKNKYEIFKSTNMAEGETLKKQEEVSIGDRTIKITDSYGVRGKDFKDREGQHSKGIDMTTDNKRVISLTDGVVEVASLDGSPTLVGTDKEQSGGYYLIIKNDDGTRSQYMHLDAMTPEEQKNIIGKRVKRGDDLGGYGVGSGSGTGPHIKYRVFTGDLGTQLETHIDPSSYITGSNTAEPKPKYIIGEDENGKYVETLVDKGQPKIEFDPNKRGSSSQPGERYVKQYVKGAEILSTRTIGDNEYIVKAYTDDEGVLQNEYLSFTEKGADKNKLKKENKYELYKREISNIMQGGLTEENVEKAKDVYDTAIEDYRRSGDDELPDKDQKSYRVGNHFYKLAGAPFLEQEIKNVKQKQQEKLLDLQNKHASAFGEEKQKIGEQIKILEKDYADIVKQDKEISQSIKKITEGTPPTFMQGTPVIMGDFGQRSSRAERDQFDWYQDLFKDQVKKYRESEAYKSYYLDQQKQAELDKKAAARTGTTGTTTTTTTTTTAAPDVATGTAVDPDDIDFTQEEIDVTGKDYIDKSYLEEQLAEVNKQLDNVQKAEEFTPDLSMLDNRDRYGNLIAMASDLGVGYMGLKGAMEEIPEYEKGEMFKAYTDEAYRQRNMGYTPEEMGLRKQLAERGFGYDVKNIRRLTGGSAGVALGNLGRAAGTLQNRYAQIAAEDSAIRRLNQQRFDRAASADEAFNRRKFEDDFKVAMMNKEMGAQLVRDKMTDMRERQQFQEQYGKGSVYDAMSREMLKSQQYNVHALKMAEQYQKDKQQDFLKQRQADIQSKLNQANR